jgi:hypothetical protein
MAPVSTKVCGFYGQIEVCDRLRDFYLHTMRPTLNYLAVTISAEPKAYLLAEGEVGDRIIHARPIFHTWLRNSSSVIIGLKFSAWMVHQGSLSRDEKSIVAGWTRGGSDLEVYFGPDHGYEEDLSLDEVSRNTAIVKLDKDVHGLSFPLFGDILSKADRAHLEASLENWVKTPVDTEVV